MVNPYIIFLEGEELEYEIIKVKRKECTRKCDDLFYNLQNRSLESNRISFLLLLDLVMEITLPQTCFRRQQYGAQIEFSASFLGIYIHGCRLDLCIVVVTESLLVTFVCGYNMYRA